MESQSQVNIWLKYNQSELENVLNEILEKISIGSNLSEYEIHFLEKYDKNYRMDLINFSHLSKNQIYIKIIEILKKNKRIICDLCDKMGKISDEIISIYNNVEMDYSTLQMKHGDTYNLKDNMLYKLTYDFKKDEYHLESVGEYYEKITNDNENI